MDFLRWAVRPMWRPAFIACQALIWTLVMICGWPEKPTVYVVGVLNVWADWPFLSEWWIRGWRRG